MTLASFSRWQAFLIHLGISVLIAMAMVGLTLALWYPPPYFAGMGGPTLLRLLIGVDVVLGPLMTLVVFNPAKKSLRFDLSVIAALQVAALIYGLTVMAQARPVFVVYTGERFTIVAANQIAPESYAGAKPPFDSPPVTGPMIVGARMPDDPRERERVMLLLVGGVDLPMIPRYYVPISDMRDVLKAKSRPFADLEARSAGAKGAASAAVARSNRKRESLAWLPVLGRLEAGSAIVDLDRGDVVAVLPVDPF